MSSDFIHFGVLIHYAIQDYLDFATKKFEKTHKHTRLRELGPMDVLEMAAFEAALPNLLLVDHEGKHVGFERREFQQGLKWALATLPTNNTLSVYSNRSNGSSLRACLPEFIEKHSKLWVPDSLFNVRLLKRRKMPSQEEREENLKGQNILHNTMSLIWSRIGYQISFLNVLWLQKALQEYSANHDVLFHDFFDFDLYDLNKYFGNWQELENTFLAVDTEFYEKHWEKALRLELGVNERSIGRPNKVKTAVDCYFDLFPKGHKAFIHPIFATTTWAVVLRMLTEKGIKIGESTLREGVKADPRSKFL